MLRFHETEENDLTMAVREEGYRMAFGVVSLQGSRVLNIKEKPVQKAFVNAGIYVIDPSVLSLLQLNSFYDMPDFINKLIVNGKQVGSFPIHEYWLDIGRYDDLEKAQRDENVL